MQAKALDHTVGLRTASRCGSGSSRVFRQHLDKHAHNDPGCTTSLRAAAARPTLSVRDTGPPLPVVQHTNLLDCVGLANFRVQIGTQQQLAVDRPRPVLRIPTKTSTGRPHGSRQATLLRWKAPGSWFGSRYPLPHAETRPNLPVVTGQTGDGRQRTSGRFPAALARF
jgi:hypothetical protein